MDDFLTTLVSRTLGHQQTLLPRRASRFEPEQPEQAAETLDESRSRIAVRFTDGQDPPAYTPRATQDDDEPEPGPDGRYPRSPAERRMSPPAESQDRDAAVVHVDRADVSDGGGPLAEPIPPQRTDSSGDHLSRLEKAVPVTLLPDAPFDEEPLVAEGHRPAKHDSLIAEQSINAPEARRAPFDPPRGTGREVTADALPRSRAERQADGEKAVPEELLLRFTTRIAALDELESRVHDDGRSLQGPRITVSIGRIDVKSAQPAPAIRPPAIPSRYEPQLSLGEYLERARRVRR